MEKHDHHSSGFGNGFLLGIIVGAAIVFFLFTKRGRQLLKVITEEGIEGVEEFKELLDLDGDDEAFEEDPQEKVERVVTRAEAVVAPIKKTAKRFFRGTSKKK